MYHAHVYIHYESIAKLDLGRGAFLWSGYYWRFNGGNGNWSRIAGQYLYAFLLYASIKDKHRFQGACIALYWSDRDTTPVDSSSIIP